MAKLKKREKSDDSVLYAFLATFLSIVGFVIAIVVRRRDKYVMFYARQSIVIFVIGAIAGVLASIIGWIPIIGWIVSFALSIFVMLLWVLSWIYALSGKEKDVLFVGEYARKIKI